MGALISRIDHPMLGKRIEAPPGLPAPREPHGKRRRTDTGPEVAPKPVPVANGRSGENGDGGAPRQDRTAQNVRQTQNYQQKRPVGGNPDRDPRDLEAPVRAEFRLRVIRDAESVRVVCGGKELYSDAFLKRLTSSESVLVQRVDAGTLPGSFPKSPGPAEGNLDSDEGLKVHGGTGTGRKTPWIERTPPAGYVDQSNFLSLELRTSLRKKNVPVERADRVLKLLNTIPPESVVGSFGEAEKKKVDVNGKMILAPLTTQGNLPYRLIMKQMGVDITIGEMALADSITKGFNSEWALLRRHKMEDVFGVQLAGSNPAVLAHAAEIVSRECDVDFIDLNAGCPIDLICNRGAGCSLMSRTKKFTRIVAAASCASSVPFSVKMRIGFDSSHINAHKIIPNLARSGAAWVTVHGRTRTQRYSRSADWDYIRNECAPAAAAAGIPLVGNGDIYTWRDAAPYLDSSKEEGGVSGVMLARGALIKPWLATEIRERRDWDISSSERLELYRDFCREGLAHWGADKKGVETTRKFLLEWLSFTYRYVPLGLLEVASEPTSMRHRAPVFRGRDEKETLFASHSAGDWMRISEMFLGPVPAGFKFKARHNSNAWAAGAGGGR